MMDILLTMDALKSHFQLFELAASLKQ